MKTFRGILLRTAGLIWVVLIGWGVFVALSDESGSARTSLSNVNVTAISPSPVDRVIYASVADPVNAGLYRSTDGGRSWEMVSRQLDRRVNAMAVSPQDSKVVYAGTEGGSIALERDSLLVSTDGGRTWNRTPLLLPANAEGHIPSVLSLAVDPQDANTLYVGTDGQGLYKLTDKGTTLMAIGGEFSQARIDAIAIASTDSQKVFVATSQGLFKSTDAGDSWQRIDSLPEQPVSVAVALGADRVVYVGTVSMGAYRSDDGGQTWKAISGGLGLTPGAALTVKKIEVDPQDPYHVFAVPSYIFAGYEQREVLLGIFESHDGGESWQKIRSGDTVGQVNAVALSPTLNGNLYVASNRGVVLANRDDRAARAIAPGEVNNALARVTVILVTAVAAIAVILIKPVYFCRTLLHRLVRDSCNTGE